MKTLLFTISGPLIVQRLAQLTVQFLILSIAHLSSAAVLPLETILNKNVAQSQFNVLRVDQNVVFRDGAQELVVREEWLIEGDKNMRLTATGMGLLRDTFRLSYLYNNDVRTHVSGKNRLRTATSPDFFERYLSVKSRDSYLEYLKRLQITPQVRLSRAGGQVAFAIGTLSPVASPMPQLWFDQEWFRLIKMRLLSGAQAEFSDYEEYGKVSYPKKKRIEWEDKAVTIHVLNVETKNSATIQDFYPEKIEMPSEIAVGGRTPLGTFVEDFYKRFR